MQQEEIYEILDKAYFSLDMDEKDVIINLSKLLKSAKLFVDIGASLGQYTYFANQCMSKGEIVAIEADPIRYEKLLSNCKEWTTSSANEIKCLHCAISDYKGQVSFFTTNSNVSGGLFKHNLDHLRDEVKKNVKWSKVRVDSFTLDTLFHDRVPDCIKIDIEGSELSALRGSKNILKKGRTIFLVEIHNWVDPNNQCGDMEVFKFIQGFGYSHFNFYGMTLFIKDPGFRFPLFRLKSRTYTILGVVKQLIKKFQNIILAY